MSGRRELWRSLRTSDFNEAKLLSLREGQEVERYFQALRTQAERAQTDPESFARQYESRARSADVQHRLRGLGLSSGSCPSSSLRLAHGRSSGRIFLSCLVLPVELVDPLHHLPNPCWIPLRLCYAGYAFLTACGVAERSSVQCIGFPRSPASSAYPATSLARGDEWRTRCHKDEEALDAPGER